MIIRYTKFVCAGRIYQYSSDTITINLATIAICSTSTKDKIKLQIIIFCVKHNREQTITLEFEIGTGHGRGGCDMIYLSIVLFSAIKYSCIIYKYINITQGYQRNKNIHNT